MRIMVMFDLPTLTNKDLKEYRTFRKFLLSNGFIMMQESIYIKLVLSPTSAELVRNQVRKSLPKDGLIQMLTVTERQFQNMELLCGKVQDKICDTRQRLVEL